MRVGPYRLGAELGSGAMGTVWQAVGPTGPVAVKAVGPAARQQPVLVQALRAEIRLAVDLDHPSIARLVDTGSVTAAEAAEAPDRLVAGAPWVALELAEGSLEERRPTAVAQVRDVLDAVLAALAHAHARGIVHRDVKPANVLDHPDPARRWLLSDFGLALARGGEGEALQGGTAGYAAPEQRRGELGRQGPWTDLYAVGALACWLFTGDPDGWPETLAQAWKDWIGWLIEADPAERCRHATEARAVLATLPRTAQALPLEPGVAPRSDATLLGWLDDMPEPRTSGVSRIDRVEVRWASWRAPSVPLQVGPGLVRARTPPLVGREAEQDLLWEALRQARSGERAVVMVRGGPGSGRSRLARWVVERAQELGLGEGFGARHSPLGGGSFGLRALVGGALRIAEGASPDAVRAALDDVDLPDPEAVVELLCPEMPRLRLARPGRVLSVVSEVLAVLSGPRPPVVWLDDVQWGPDTLRWLATGLDALTSGALLVCTVADELLADRPVEAERIAALEGARTLRLGPLAADQAVALARATVDLDPEVAGLVAEHTGGAPLFLTQLLRSWADEGMRRAPGGGLLPAQQRSDWPRDLDAVWRRRLDHALSEAGGSDAREALELACCLGEHIDDQEWVQACAQMGLERPPALVPALLAAGVLLPLALHPPRWELVHRRLAALVLEPLEPGPLEDRYRACARVVEGVPGDWQRRAVLWDRAGEPSQAAWYRTVAVMNMLTDDVPASLAMAERWAAALGPGPERAHAWCSLASGKALAGDAAGARVQAERALAEAEAFGDPSAQARALQVIASDVAQRDLHEAIALLRRALEVGPKRGGLAGRGFVPSMAWIDLAQALSHLQRDDEALEASEHALAAADNASQRIQALLHGASFLLHRGRIGEARERIARCADLHHAMGASLRSVYHQVLAGIAIAEADLATAREQLEVSLELRSWAGLASPFGHTMLADIDLAEADLAAAERRLIGLTDLPRTRAVAAACAAMRGDLGAVESYLTGVGGPPVQIYTREPVASALERQGRADLAARWLSSTTPWGRPRCG